MKNLIKTELAWAAGFFDGEGSIGSYFGGGRNRDCQTIMLSVAQSSDNGVPYVLERFKNVFSEGRILSKRRRKNARKPEYMFYTPGFEKSQFVIAAMWNYLSPVKRMQAEKALQLYKEHKANRASALLQDLGLL